jgi:hypothetical protein
MFEFTKNNHFKFGYKESGWFKNRTSPTETFTCDYGRADAVMGFRDANIYAAKYIADIATDDISVMLSGGADSEITAWALLDAGIPFRAAVMRFKDGKNKHDIDYAIKFCQYHNIDIDFYDLDVEEYLLSSEFENTVKSYQTTCERATSLWLAKQIPNFTILGQGEPVVVKYLGKWCFQEKERICSWNKYWIFNQIPGIPGFHQFSPEQILSCLKDEMTLDLINDKTDYWSNDKFKHSFYKKHYPEFEIRDKYTGFEKLAKINIPMRERILATFPYFIGEWQITYEQAINNLSPL